jgi:cell division inhibitor SepF
MSTLHRLKAYFGMVPAEELHDYDPDYDPDYEAGHRAGHDYYDYAPRDGADHEARHGSDHDEAINDVRGRSYASERAVPRRPRRAAREDYDGRARYGRAEDGYVEPEVAMIRAVHRPGSSADAPPVCGALAVDTAAALREPVREPTREPVREPTREPVREPLPRSHPPFPEDGHRRPRIVTLHPGTYNEARTIGECYREGTPVIMNLTGMDDADAKRLVDFAAGLAFALRGSIDKVTTKVFLLSPTDVAVSAEDTRRIAGDGVSRQS